VIAADYLLEIVHLMLPGREGGWYAKPNEIRHPPSLDAF
jgi:hypothetical protein